MKIIPIIYQKAYKFIVPNGLCDKMVFFRIKKIKGKEYAYIVENEWKRKGSRQKVKGYLGRVHRFNLVKDIEFLKYINVNDAHNYINNNNKNKIINDLVGWEIFKFGIIREEFSINLINNKIEKGKKKVALLINDGFMCNFTLKNLLEFKPEGDEQIDGYRFARAFVEAGVKVPQDIFVELFGKLYKKSI